MPMEWGWAGWRITSPGEVLRPAAGGSLSQLLGKKRGKDTELLGALGR